MTHVFKVRMQADVYILQKILNRHIVSYFTGTQFVNLVPMAIPKVQYILIANWSLNGGHNAPLPQLEHPKTTLPKITIQRSPLF